MTTMQAVRIHRFGGPDVLQLDTVPVPAPGPDELLVHVRAAGVNPVDFKIRSGHFPPVTAAQLPLTPGRDISGAVAGGTAGGFREGDAVFAMLTPDHGGYAEYALVSAAHVAIKPARIEHGPAASVPVAALTAWQGLFEHGQLHAGQRVLIHGGAGGVGHLAVQFAKNSDAFVYATVSARDLEFMQELGVDRAIDREAEAFEDIAQDVDLVLDLIGGDTQQRSLGLLRPGGRLVSTLVAPAAEDCRARGIVGLNYVVHPDGRQLAAIAAMIDEARLRAEVAETFPLAQAGAAHARLEAGGVRGKIVLAVG